MAPLALVTSNQWEVQSGYCKFPMGVMQRPELSMGAKVLYSLVLDGAKSKGWVMRSQAWLCHHLGIKRRATLRDYIAELVEYGLIQVKSGQIPGCWSTFRLLDHIWLHKVMGWTESGQGGGRKASTGVAGKRLQIQSRENRGEEESDQNTSTPLRGVPEGEDLVHVKDPVIVHDPDVVHVLDVVSVHEEKDDAVKIEDLQKYSAIASAKRSEEAKNAPPPEPEPVVEDNGETQDVMEHLQDVVKAGSKKGDPARENRDVKDWGKKNPTVSDKIHHLNTKHKIPHAMKVVAHKLGDIWFDEFKMQFPGTSCPKAWAAKEMVCAATLILLYDFNTAADAVRYFLRNWDRIQPRVLGGKVAVPSIGVLKVSHDTIVPEAGKLTKAMKAVSAYNEWGKQNPTVVYAPPELEKAYTTAVAELKAFGLKP